MILNQTDHGLLVIFFLSLFFFSLSPFSLLMISNGSSTSEKLKHGHVFIPDREFRVIKFQMEGQLFIVLIPSVDGVTPKQLSA